MSGLGKVIVLFLLLVFCYFFVSIPEVEAESRTIVVPEDYSTIQQAVDSAADGDVVFVKNGTYKESVSINKQISLIGQSRAGTIIEGNWGIGGTIILVQHDNVVVKQLTLKAVSESGRSGRGVHLLHVKGCNVSYCDIEAGIGVWFYGSSDNTVEKNQMDGTGYWIDTAGVELGYSENNSITKNTIQKHIYGYGALLYFSDGNRFTENQLTDNYRGVTVRESDNNKVTDNKVSVSTGVYVRPTDETMRGSYGIKIQQSSNTSITGNSLMYCPNGVLILSNSSHNIVENNAISNSCYVGVTVAYYSNHNKISVNNLVDNGVGVKFVNSSDNLVHHNGFINNGVLVSSHLDTEVNFFDDGIEGNFWSDYNGTDGNGDGVGDTPYIIDDNNQDNFPLMERYAIPEFPSWTILPLVLTITLFSVVVKRKLYTRNPELR